MLTRRKKSFAKILLRGSISILSVALLTFGIISIPSIVLEGVAKSDPVPFSDKEMIIEKHPTTVGLPAHFKIPVADIDTAIYYVGLTSDGAMDIKNDPIQVAWYEFGPRPGEVGSAVIAGHYGWTNGVGSVFNNLHDLVKGDQVIITDNNGVSTVFIVRESKKYNPDAETSDIFKSSDGKAHLNLITCGGTWINSKNTYSDRLVVFTDKE